MSESKSLAVRETSHGRALSVFSNEDAFASAQRMCKALISSDLVPTAYRGEGGMGNALIALDMANRMGIPAIMVMQNLDVIEGRPSWKSQFILGALNSCGLFSPIRFRVDDHGEREVSYKRWSGPKGNRSQETVKAKVHDKTCIAYAVEKATGEILEGPPVSIGMAIAEGWYHRPGSKWQTMADLMLRYRSAAFFGRLYAPHILNGMPMVDEVIDVEYEVLPRQAPAAAEAPADADDKPETRPKGVHAAMKAAKEPEKKPASKAKAKPADKEPDPEPEADENADPETGEIIDAEVEDADDVFGGPDEDDYQPA